MPKGAGFSEIVGSQMFGPVGYVGGSKVGGDGRDVGGGGRRQVRIIWVITVVT